MSHHDCDGRRGDYRGRSGWYWTAPPLGPVVVSVILVLAHATVLGAGDAAALPARYEFSGVYVVMCQERGKCLDASAQDIGSNGCSIQLWQYLNQSNQRWEIRPVPGGNNIWKLVSCASGKALEVESTSATKDGGKVQLCDYLEGKNQHWEIRHLGDGVYSIKSCASGKVLDASASAPDQLGHRLHDGTKVQVWDDLETANQRWMLLRCSGLHESLSVSSVSLAQNLVPGESSSEEVEVPAGAKLTLRRSKTIDHTVSVTWRAGAELGVEGALRTDWVTAGAEIRTQIRARVESTTGQTWAVSETKEQTVEVDGAVLRRARIVWTDKLRKGNAIVKLNGTDYEIPFEFREGTDLKVEKIE
jgi:Ricin-type beta-trefoil lectin domain-like